MKNFHKIVVLLTVLSVGVGIGGYFTYRQAYRKPRAAATQKRLEIENQIAFAENTARQTEAISQQLAPLYTRSLPLNPTNAKLEYQIWLTQILEFCNVKNPVVQARDYQKQLFGALAVQKFGVQMECSQLDLIQFLYEFYWTPFLHRIAALDVQPKEGSDLLQVTATIEGLTILFRQNPRQPFPLQDKLPLSANPPRQLASGPFAAYRPTADADLFRAVKTGVDPANFAILTGLPTISDENGQTAKFARWNIETENRTLNLKVGDSLKIGSFEATIVDVSDDLVVLRQQSGRTWIVPLGKKLNEAVAVPSNLF